MEVFVNDSVKLLLDTGKDISAFTVWRIKYKRPDGVTGYWNAAVCPTNSDRIQADLTGRISMHGTWRVQAYVSNGGEVYHGMWADFKVFSPLLS